MTALHRAYRPSSFDYVYGQDAAVAALHKNIQRRESQTFLLSGPSGVGKTTVARIAAAELGCDPITELDGATYTGVDAMRTVQETLQYRPLGTSSSRAIILDECHRLSAQAWDSLLKILEEPPKHIFWFLCTTLPSKLPTTVQTRCVHLQLKSLDKETLTKLVDEIAAEEHIKLKPEIRQMVVSEAHGSARQALVNLEVCRDITTREDAAEVLKTALETDASIELCRLLASGNGTWAQAMTLVEKLNGQNAEGVRILAMSYFATAAKRAKTDRDATFFLQRLEEFAQPYGQGEADAQLLRSIGHCIFG